MKILKTLNFMLSLIMIFSFSILAASPPVAKNDQTIIVKSEKMSIVVADLTSRTKPVFREGNFVNRNTVNNHAGEFLIFQNQYRQKAVFEKKRGFRKIRYPLKS